MRSSEGFKVHANRLRQYIGSVIGKDQSQCVPVRSIHDNIHFIRNIIFYSNSTDTHLPWIICIKKAFDNVDHGYLFDTLRAIGFGDSFISYLQMLYSGAEILVKVCGSMTSPFPFDKKIRQGCPLSGLLYLIAIEPLLNKRRKTPTDREFNIPETDFLCAVSAYVDDI